MAGPRAAPAKSSAKLIVRAIRLGIVEPGTDHFLFKSQPRTGHTIIFFQPSYRRSTSQPTRPTNAHTHDHATILVHVPPSLFGLEETKTHTPIPETHAPLVVIEQAPYGERLSNQRPRSLSNPIRRRRVKKSRLPTQSGTSEDPGSRKCVMFHSRFMRAPLCLSAFSPSFVSFSLWTDRIGVVA